MSNQERARANWFCYLLVFFPTSEESPKATNRISRWIARLPAPRAGQGELGVQRISHSSALTAGYSRNEKIRLSNPEAAL